MNVNVTACPREIASPSTRRSLMAIGATEGLAVVIDLLEKRCDLFSLSAKDNAVLLNLLY